MPDTETSPAFSSRFFHALQFASHIHAHQRRKGGNVPYLSHLMAVSALVLDFGGTETEAIGALLHDAAEDCGGRKMLAQIGSTFGEDVARIVEGCTDTFDDPKPAWKPRKEAYVAHLRTAGDSVRTVACADKLHNLTCTVRDLRRHLGSDYWKRFNTGSVDQEWYYEECGNAFRAGKPPAMMGEYELAFAEFKRLVGSSNLKGNFPDVP